MAKLGHQQAPLATDQADVASKEFVENLKRITASGDYLQAVLSADMTASLTVSDPIEFDSVQTNRGALSLDTTTNVGRISGLKAGRTYVIRGRARASGAADWVSYRWYDLTAATYIGSLGTSTAMDSTLALGDNPEATMVLTPTQDTELELRVTNFNIATVDIAAANTTYFQIMEVGAAVVDAPSGLEYMDTITVGSAVASVTFGEGGDGVTGRALDGDVDEIYELFYHWPKPNLTLRALEIHPNGTDVGASSSFDRHISSGSVSNGSGWVFCQVGTSGSGTGVESTGQAVIHAKTGKKRALTASFTASAIGGTDVIGAEMYSSWTDTSTNITSLEIIDTAANLPVGTELVLYRRVKNPIRADSADTYERRVESAVDVGSATTEQTTGHTAFGGSVVGLTARIEDAVTAGTVTVNLKVDGVTTLSTVLDTTDTVSNRAVSAIGDHTFAADKNVSVEIVSASYDNAGSVTSGITVVATLVNEALIQPAVDRLRPLESNLWYPPDVAHDWDEEFDSVTLDPKWDGGTILTPTAGLPDIYTDLASGNPKAAYHTQGRNSWALWQAASDSSFEALRQTGLTLPTNLLTVARLRFTQTSNAAVNDDGTIGIEFGTFPDALRLLLKENDTGQTLAEFHKYESSSFTLIGNSTDVDRQGQALEYVALHKIGTTYHAWIGTAGGNWVYLGSTVFASSTPTTVGFFIGGNSTTDPGGPLIVGADFIRFYETDKFLL